MFSVPSKLNALFSTLALPVLLVAPLAGAANPAPIPASTVPLVCDPPQLSLVYDVDDELLYLETDIGLELLRDNELDVAFDSNSSTLLELEFTSREWIGDVEEDGVFVGSYASFRGVFESTIVDSVDIYGFSLDPATPGEGIPTVPLTIKTDKNCPPED